MKTLIIACALAMMAATPAKAENFALPELDYAYDALSPVIDAETMEIHLTKHHQAYVNNLNAEVEKTAALKGKSLETILSDIASYSMAVRNNAGGHWNHSFFWKLMAEKDKRGEISPALQKAIEGQWGSLDAFKEAFEKAGASQFGSGWVWLIVKSDKTLDITTTPNQNNPLMGDAVIKGKPVLGNDVWEHAYYLNYQNKRADYLKKWWEVVNWTQVSQNYADALQ